MNLTHYLFIKIGQIFCRRLATCVCYGNEFLFDCMITTVLLLLMNMLLKNYKNLLYFYKILISEVYCGFKYFSFKRSYCLRGIMWWFPKKIILCCVVINSETLRSIVSLTGQYCFDTISVDFSKPFPLTTYSV